MELRDYQLEGNRKIWRLLCNGAAVLLQSPTGAGKTAMFTHIAKMLLDHRGEKSIAVAHRREIVNQMAEKMEWAGMVPEVIMAGHMLNPWANVTVASKGTLASRMRRGTSRKLADLLIVDEGHLVSKDGEYARLIGQHKEAGGMLLLATATPIRGDGYGLGNVCDEMVRTPDVPWLIEHGYLCRPDHHICHVPSTVGLGGDGNDFNQARVAATMNTKELIGDVVENWLEFGKGRPSLIFCSGVEHSQAIVERVRNAGYRAEHVDGDTDKEVRDSIYKRSENGEIDLISNDSVYIEGTDFPWISYVGFAFITKSLRKLMQAGGRGMRPYKRKENCLMADHGGNIYRLGRLDIPRDWELSTDIKIQEKMEEQRKKTEKMSVTCPECGLVHSCKICPKCHAEPKQAADKSYINAMLEQMTVFDWETLTAKLPKIPRPKMDEKQAFYSGLLMIAQQRGFKDGWVSHKYQEKFGVWPKGLDRIPRTPRKAVVEFERESRKRYLAEKKHHEEG
jgi:DNA repair protein RadD